MRSLTLLTLSLLLAGCVSTPPLRPATPPAAAPRPVPLPAPVPLAADWRDWPLTPGDWVYRQDPRGSIALFGRPGQDADFSLRCDLTARQIYLSRKGTVTAPITIRTSTALRALPASPAGPVYVASALLPTDSLLDAMGYSRGRFVVEQPGLPTLVIPAWPEILRVTEDCR